MIQLFLHLLGDYFLQNDWMASNKSKWTITGWFACNIHCLLYSIPFGLYYNDFGIFAWIFISHFLIDKFGLAVYVTKFVNWNWKSKNFGFGESRPPHLTVWITIIRDNSMHIACNYFIIKYFL